MKQGIRFGIVMLSAFGALHCSAPAGPEGDLDAPGRGVGGGGASTEEERSNPTTPTDTSKTGSDVPTTPQDPAEAACDSTKPFGAPLAVAGLPADMHLSTPRLAGDERTIYFTMHENGVSKLGRAVRPTAATPFGAPQALPTLASNVKDNDPAPSADGKMLWFSSERSGQGDELFVAMRTDPTAEFSAPIRVEGVGSGSDEQHPWYRVAGDELWFSSSRNGTWDIWVSQRTPNGVFAAPKRVDELHDTASTRQPMVSEDGLTILFASERSGGAGERDLWLAKRASTKATFDAPKALSELNSAADEFGGWLSADGCRIYFSSDREVAKRHRIYMASRPK